ncbi:TIGR00282 family metallophosphoesterase [SAR202 cluster bacterium AD-804-J14_MRT_500m]|nr:TIGR00282 family metallophosphoesterase [SAR202 cluster bacterium AD-804-J14_MRT_500m]
MRVLMIGDIVGRPGRQAVERLVPSLRRELQFDLVVANGENVAGGFGITPVTFNALYGVGVDVVTTGNHVWRKKEIIPFLDEEIPLIRPSNFPPGAPGQGYINLGNVLIINLMGRVFMEPLDCPFREADRILQEVQTSTAPRVILVDFHAEATSEKQAMGWFLDGRVSAVVGTHTHVPTADYRVLPGGTGYVSDLGMVGPLNSVIGMDSAGVVEKFLTQTPHLFEVAKGPVSFNSVLVEIDEETGKAIYIDRIDREVE